MRAGLVLGIFWIMELHVLVVLLESALAHRVAGWWEHVGLLRFLDDCWVF